MNEPEFDSLALQFSLAAALAPASTAVAATDLNGHQYSSSDGDLPMIDPDQIQSHVTALENAAERTGRAHLLSHPDRPFDILLEAAWDDRTSGYIEHNRSDGSSYFELDKTGTAAAESTVTSRIAARIAQLVAHGWDTVATAAPRPAAINPGRTRDLYCTVAAAEALAATLIASPRDGGARDLDLIDGASTAADPLTACLTRWGQAWVGEMTRRPGATTARKRAEHRLASIDAALLRDYHRRAAALPVHAAMSAATAARLAMADPALKAALDARLEALWAPPVDPFAALAAWRSWHTRWEASVAADQSAPIRLDFDTPAPTAELGRAVARRAHRLALDLLGAPDPAADDTGTQTRADISISVDGRDWTGWIAPDSGGLVLPPGHPWAGPSGRVPTQIPLEGFVVGAVEIDGTPAVQISSTARTSQHTPPRRLEPASMRSRLRTLAAHAALDARIADAAHRSPDWRPQ